MDYLWYKVKEAASSTKKQAQKVHTKYIAPTWSSMKYHWNHIVEIQKNPVIKERAVFLSTLATSAREGRLEPFTINDVYLATDNMFMLSKFFYAQDKSYAPSQKEIMQLVQHAHEQAETLNTDEKVEHFYQEICKQS